MERKKMILAGGLVVAGGLIFSQAMRLNAPATIVAAPTEEAKVEVVDYVGVLVATADVTRGQRITQDMLDWAQWPEDSLTPTMIVETSRPQAMEELDAAVVRTDIFTGEPIIDAKLVRAGDSGLMAALLGPGMRAVTTRVTVDSAVGGFILPGDKVDIMLTVQLPRQREGADGRQQTTQYAAQTIFSNVKVLAMNDVYAAGPESPASVNSPSFATFELNQTDSERLMEAAELGNISLSLRGLSQARSGRSAATAPRSVESSNSTMVVYRNGQQTQAAIRRQ